MAWGLLWIASGRLADEPRSVVVAAAAVVAAVVVLTATARLQRGRSTDQRSAGSA